MRIMTVNYLIDGETEKKLDELLEMAKKYEQPEDGKRPFEDYDKDNLFRFALEMGSAFHIAEQLDLLKMMLRRRES